MHSTQHSIVDNHQDTAPDTDVTVCNNKVLKMPLLVHILEPFPEPDPLAVDLVLILPHVLPQQGQPPLRDLLPGPQL